MRARIHPSALGGSLAVPPSKSMAHRAVICAALAAGTSHISNIEYSQDITATIEAMRQLGAKITPTEAGLTVQGCGGMYATVTRPVNCRESGSTLRFLWPVFSLTSQKVTFTGAGRLMQRPLTVYEDIAQKQKLRTTRTENSVSVWGAVPPGVYAVPGNLSSQFISGLALALPLTEQGSILDVMPPFESRSYVNLTLDAMRAFGVTAQWQNLYKLVIPGGQRYTAADYTVEGDCSQAAFAAVLGAAVGGITLTGLPEETSQGDAAFVPILRRCGARLAVQPGCITFEKASLTGTEIDLADCPDLGPILMVLGALCTGTTVIRNAGRLRIKESDRIAAMEAELRKLGVEITSDENTVTVHGYGPGSLHAPAQPLYGHNDHRVVMSLAVLALAAGLTVEIDGAEAVSKSWPTFFEAIEALGARVEKENG